MARLRQSSWTLTTPALVDDGNDGWWSGAQRNFVAVPVAALALSAAIAIVGSQYDDLPQAPAPSVVDDEAGWQPSTVASAPCAWTVQTEPDDLPAPFVDDESAHWPTVPSGGVRPVWTGLPLHDTDFGAPPVLSVVDDEAGRLVLSCAIPAVRWLSLPADADFVPSTPPHEDDAPLLVWSTPPVVAGIVRADDEIVPLAGAPPIVDEAYVWINPTALVPPRTITWVDPDTQFARATVEDDWQVWTPPLVAARPLYAPDRDLDIVPQPAPSAIDEGQGWSVPVVVPPDPKTIVWVDGDAIFRAVVVEEDWNVWTPPLVPALLLYAPDPDLVIVPQPPVSAQPGLIVRMTSQTRAVVPGPSVRAVVTSAEEDVAL